MIDNTTMEELKESVLLDLLTSDLLIICYMSDIGNDYVLGESFMKFIINKFTIIVNLCSNTHYSPIRGYTIIKDEESLKIYNYFNNKYEDNNFLENYFLECDYNYCEFLKRLQEMKKTNVIEYYICNAKISVYYNKSIYKPVLREDLNSKYKPTPINLYLEKISTDEAILIESRFDLNLIIHNIMNNKHNETEKRELYTNIVKLMASDGKFKENFMQIEDFDDKILLLEIYKDMFNK